MCLAVIAVDAHPRIALLVAANRDEYHARPAAPAAWDGDVLAGRDLMAGGTWLAVRRDGRFAFVTNVRDGRAQDPAARTRGELPLLALSGAAIDGMRYNGFNLVAGDAHGFTWTSNRGDGSRRVTSGVHGLSNASLDVPWPKVVRTQRRIVAWLRGDGRDLAAVFDALGDRAQAAEAELPSTGVAIAWERLLSAPFIVSERYGTRCSTVLVVDRDGNARFVERSFGPDGTLANEAAFEFEITTRATAPSPGAVSPLP
jgi:uncharacterized protein with NRDE domain